MNRLFDSFPGEVLAGESDLISGPTGTDRNPTAEANEESRLEETLDFARGNGIGHVYPQMTRRRR